MDRTFDDPAENLACDEALLDQAEQTGDAPALRFWEPKTTFVVVGYANKVASEVDVPACKKLGIPVLRRCSGGGTVLQGPGCLNYALVLPIGMAPELESITGTNHFILNRHCQALSRLTGGEIACEGATDLVMGGRKCSGNSQRRKRKHLLFHGTFLLDFDLEAIGRVLPFPSKQPEYRKGRSHGDFVTNLRIPAVDVKAVLRDMWRDEMKTRSSASSDATDCKSANYGEHSMSARIQQLMAERYASEEWHLKC